MAEEDRYKIEVGVASDEMAAKIYAALYFTDINRRPSEEAIFYRDAKIFCAAPEESRPAEAALSLSEKLAEKLHFIDNGSTGYAMNSDLTAQDAFDLYAALWAEYSNKQWHFVEIPENNGFTLKIIANEQGEVAMRYRSNADRALAHNTEVYVNPNIILPEIVPPGLLAKLGIETSPFSDLNSLLEKEPNESSILETAVTPLVAKIFWAMAHPENSGALSEMYHDGTVYSRFVQDSEEYKNECKLLERAKGFAEKYNEIKEDIKAIKAINKENITSISQGEIVQYIDKLDTLYQKNDFSLCTFEPNGGEIKAHIWYNNKNGAILLCYRTDKEGNLADEAAYVNEALLRDPIGTPLNLGVVNTPGVEQEVEKNNEFQQSTPTEYVLTPEQYGEFKRLVSESTTPELSIVYDAPTFYSIYEGKYAENLVEKPDKQYYRGSVMIPNNNNDDITVHDFGDNTLIPSLITQAGGQAIENPWIGFDFTQNPPSISVSGTAEFPTATPASPISITLDADQSRVLYLLTECRTVTNPAKEKMQYCVHEEGNNPLVLCEKKKGRYVPIATLRTPGLYELEYESDQQTSISTLMQKIDARVTENAQFAPELSDNICVTMDERKFQEFVEKISRISCKRKKQGDTLEVFVNEGSYEIIWQRVKKGAFWGSDEILDQGTMGSFTPHDGSYTVSYSENENLNFRKILKNLKLTPNSPDLAAESPSSVGTNIPTVVAAPGSERGDEPPPRRSRTSSRPQRNAAPETELTPLQKEAAFGILAAGAGAFLLGKQEESAKQQEAITGEKQEGITFGKVVATTLGFVGAALALDAMLNQGKGAQSMGFGFGH